MLNVNPGIIDTISQIIAVDGVLLAFLAFSMPALMYIVCVFLLDVEQEHADDVHQRWHRESEKRQQYAVDGDDLGYGVDDSRIHVQHWG